MSKTVAVLGLGAMGQRMAKRLVNAGHEVVVHNRTADRTEPLARLGATVAGSPREAAERSDVVISMVADDAASRAAWIADGVGAVFGLHASAVAIESSTLSPAWVASLAETVCERGAEFLEAPVVGSRPQAETGGLIYLAGGSAATLDQVRPILALLGTTVHHVGPVGTGMAMKLAVNFMFSIQVAALAELLGVLRRVGLADSRAVEVLAALPITSPAAQRIASLMTARAFAPNFPLPLVAKDVGYFRDLAEGLGSPSALSTTAHEIYVRAIHEGFAEDDIAGICQLFQ